MGKWTAFSRKATNSTGGNCNLLYALEWSVIILFMFLPGSQGTTDSHAHHLISQKKTSISVTANRILWELQERKKCYYKQDRNDYLLKPRRKLRWSSMVGGRIDSQSPEMNNDRRWETEMLKLGKQKNENAESKQGDKIGEFKLTPSCGVAWPGYMNGRYREKFPKHQTAAVLATSSCTDWWLSLLVLSICRDAGTSVEFTADHSHEKKNSCKLHKR